MRLFEAENIPSLYTRILNAVLEDGIEVGPRGMRTKELGPVAITSGNPRKRLFGHPHRHEVPIFTYIEGLWILLGLSQSDMLIHYVPGMKDFVNEETGRLDGAYGPAIRGVALGREGNLLSVPDQFETCYQRLKLDSDTRQAVVIINDPHIHDIGNLPTKDYPCTLSFQFLLRSGKLNMIATMRSQDLWKGFVYDTGEFQWFQEIMAGMLEVDLGTFTLQVGSLHLYDRDFFKAQEVVKEDWNWSLYEHVSPLDARVDFKSFDYVLRDLMMIELHWRLNTPLSIPYLCSGLTRENSFYYCLGEVIKAYNMRLQGDKEEAKAAISSIGSDLAFIYRSRWEKGEGK